MFAGIIEEIGVVKSAEFGGRHSALKVAAGKVLEDLKLGDSISVEGVCLTVSEIGRDYFQADLSPETLIRTNLGGLRAGSEVNLERALKVGDRIGGHQMSGHIDGLGEIKSCARDGDYYQVKIKAPPQIMRYIVEKGSVGVDGISLTVASCGRDEFAVAIIPFTARMTTLTKKRVGSKVNIECDMLGKYVEKLLAVGRDAKEEKRDELTKEFLAEHGFI